MLRDFAVAAVRRGLGFRKPDPDFDQAIVDEMILAQLRLEDREWLPWFLISEEATYNFPSAPAEERVPIPPGFIREPEEPKGGLYLYNGDTAEKPWTELKKVTYDRLLVDYARTGDKPAAYSLVGKYFRVLPAATTIQVHLLKMVFYRADQTLETNIENLWLKESPQSLIGHTGIRMAQLTGTAQAAADFKEMAAFADQTLIKANTAREEAGTERTWGGED